VSALAVAAAFQPDVAILDIGMPQLNGYDVAESLRKTSETPPILIALSGLGQEDDKERAVKAGFNHHFTKPVDVHVLTAFLANVVTRH
jgi:DNA-binding response OmpR family regulator